MKKGSKYRLAKWNGSLDIKNFEQVGYFWSRDDEFVDLGSNKDQFGIVIEQHGVTFLRTLPGATTSLRASNF